MKRFANAVVLAVMVAFSMQGFAASGKIAVVDVEKIMRDSPQMKAIQTKLEKDFMPRRDKLVKMEEAIKNDMEKLQRDDAVLSDKQKKEKRAKIMEAQKAFEIEGRSYQQELSAAHGKAVKELYSKVQKTLEKVAKKDGIDLILQKEAAPYSASNLNITDKVMDQMK